MRKKTKAVVLYQKTKGRTTCQLYQKIDEDGNVQGTGYFHFLDHHNTPSHKKHLRNTPSHKKHTRRRAHARARNDPVPIELFPLQEGCEMHHINSHFVIPCLSFIHEQPHKRGDLLIEGWA